MAKRLTGTNKWDKAWFRKLSPRHKALWQFLCDRCDQAGMWEIDLDSASHYINDATPITEADFKIFGDRLERFNPEKIWIVDFVEFQCGELSVKCAAHKPVFKLLQKYSLLDRVLNRVSNTQQEKEKEIELEKENEVEKDKEKANTHSYSVVNAPRETDLPNLDDYSNWTDQIVDGNDTYFVNMMRNENIPQSENLSHWIHDHRDLLSRYPKMRPPNQQAFRQSCLKHIRENYTKTFNGKSGTNKKQQHVDSVKQSVASYYSSNAEKYFGNRDGTGTDGQ